MGRGEPGEGVSSPSRRLRSNSMRTRRNSGADPVSRHSHRAPRDDQSGGEEGGEQEQHDEGQEDSRRGMARKRSRAKAPQSVKSMNEWEQDVQARRRSQVEGMDEADQGRRGSSHSPKVVEGGRRRGDGSQRWEQAEGADNSLRRARGSRQEGGAGEAQGPVLTQGRSLSRNSRTMQAAQAEEQEDAGGRARKPPRRRQRSVQRDMEGEEEAVNVEYLI